MIKTYRLGIDLGGTKIEGAVLDPSGQEIFRDRIATEQEKGYEHILSRIKMLYDRLAEKIEFKKHKLGIGTPGVISYRTGCLKNSNTLCLIGKPFHADLKKLIGHDFQMQNDANCFALAEALSGAGRGKKLVFGVIMGTGCGGGIVYKGHVLEGLQGIGGEWGHTSIDPNGPECYCGARGCVETLISGGGLERRYEREHGVKLSLKDIVELYRQGCEPSASFIQAFFGHFGRSLANLINVLDPDVVVLGGGLSNIRELYTEGIAAVRKCVFSDSLETPIVKNQLGDSAGVIGAALIGK